MWVKHPPSLSNTAFFFFFFKSVCGALFFFNERNISFWDAALSSSCSPRPLGCTPSWPGSLMILTGCSAPPLSVSDAICSWCRKGQDLHKHLQSHLCSGDRCEGIIQPFKNVFSFPNCSLLSTGDSILKYLSRLPGVGYLGNQCFYTSRFLHA